jgi:hypothetical protein
MTTIGMNLALLIIKKEKRSRMDFLSIGSRLGWRRCTLKARRASIQLIIGDKHMRDQRMISKNGIFTLSALKSWFNKLLLDINPPLRMTEKIPVNIKNQTKK